MNKNEKIENFEIVMNATCEVVLIQPPGARPMAMLQLDHPRHGRLYFVITHPAHIAEELMQVISGEARLMPREQMQ